MNHTDVRNKFARRHPGIINAWRALDDLKEKFPDGSTVSYHDRTLPLTSLRKPMTGTCEALLTSEGKPFLRVTVKDGTVVDTLPENVTLLRTPNSKITPKDQPEDLLP